MQESLPRNKNQKDLTDIQVSRKRLYHWINHREIFGERERERAKMETPLTAFCCLN